MAQIQLTGIRKSYGKETAVQDLDLTVNSGDFLTILGPSGCGKTTTLRAIAGLEEPDEGEIRFGERVVFSRRQGVIIPPENRNVGFIFQSYALWPHMTVAQNITLALKEKKISPAEIESRLTKALEMVQMEPYRNRYPSELSGGQQQRVAVSRLIALESKILLMDEPLSNLDTKLRTEMRAELKRLHRELEATTVYVTHDQAEALTLSDIVVVMNEGLIMQWGTPYDIYHNPQNLFVAEFIGEPRINFFKGKIINKEGLFKMDCIEILLPFNKELPSNSGNVIASVRPESINISYKENKDWLKVRLKSIQPTGVNTILQVQSGISEITLLQPGFIRMEIDEPLWINFDPDSLNFFDEETGNNLNT
ncbi:MAG: ABC transporter ATP-binding protein [Candidatus Marinimicrobia bacterium]|jgi:multiple sugar transport system ATP-binding protein|nr:ABC transporter ATP-binding protein [Candidatus Neomarinimicrobiota bacterium]MBT4068805.1 ABC transporter ATP-binding protein [Candidatus Neomarinimicrobiota bacterium]